MKIIDEKGRLFKVINLIDLAVIVVILAIVGLLFYKVGGLGFLGGADKEKDIMLYVKCALIQESAAKLLKVGDPIIAGNDYVEGSEITGVTYDVAQVSVSTAEGKLVVSPHPFLKDVYVSIKLHANPKDVILKIANYELRAGKSLYLKTQRVELLGTILTITVKE